MGTMFARRPGQRDDMPPIAIGSHLDTQPTGGKFDGVLGVLGALEALRTLDDAGYETYAPIEVVNWTNEEGSRFAPAMVASGVFAGAFERDWAEPRTDRDGVTFGEALERDRLSRHRSRAARMPFGAFFELHIEQGPILEAEDKDDRRRHRRAGHALVRGDGDRPGGHTGTTPMRPAQERAARRRRMIERIDAIGRKHPPGLSPPSA